MFAHLDDVYVVSKPDSIRVLSDLLADKLHTMAGIQLHEGKIRTWNAAESALWGWPSWARCVEPPWVKILGTPADTDEFVKTKVESRSEDERPLWEAWKLCLGSLTSNAHGRPRCHHLLRTVSPSQVGRHAQRHDQGMLATMGALLGGLPGDAEQKTWARRIATNLASWADALHMVSQQLPEVANDTVTQLAGEPQGCVAELQRAARDLDRCVFVGRPSWAQQCQGKIQLRIACLETLFHHRCGCDLSSSIVAAQRSALICKEKTSYYRKLATKTVRIQHEQQHEH